MRMMNTQKIRWKPSVTVAALVERDGRFLVVEEETAAGLRFNQPAGHLDEGESLVAAACRSTPLPITNNASPPLAISADGSGK